MHQNAVATEVFSHASFKWRQSNGLLWVCLSFFLVATTIAREYVVHYPDERHYTDGALQMLKTGDLLTPCQADGTPRFRKPIVAYWLVTVGFSVMQISPLAARFSSIVFGVATILVSYATAKDIWKRRDVAVLVAQIVACHPLVMLSATRSLPDMPLCFFVSLALWGFLRIHVHGNFTASSYWLAYVGTGCAVATKGIPVLTLLAYFLLVYVLHTSHGRELRRLIHFPSTAIGICVAGWWYLAMFLLHGTEAWRAFWRDQVSDRVVGVITQPLQNAAEASLTLFATGLPWLIPLIMCGTSSGAANTAAHDQTSRGTKFLIGWCLFYFCITSFITEYSHRYLLLIAPSSSLLVGYWLTNRSEIHLRNWMLGLSSGAAGVVVLLSVASVTIACQLGSQAGALGSLLAIGFVFVVIWCASRSRQWIHRAQGLGVTLHVACAMLCLVASYFALPDQGAQIAAELTHLRRYGNEGFVIWCKPALASKIRLNSQGKIDFRHVDAAEECPKPAIGERLITSTPGQVLAEHPVTLSTGYRSLKPVPFMLHLLSGQLKEYLAANEEHFCLHDLNGVDGQHAVARHMESVGPQTLIR